MKIENIRRVTLDQKDMEELLQDQTKTCDMYDVLALYNNKTNSTFLIVDQNEDETFHPQCNIRCELEIPTTLTLERNYE